MKYQNPITGKTHRTWQTLHAAIGKALGNDPTVSRDQWDAVKAFHPAAPAEPVPAWKILGLFRPALEAEYIDLDRKGRGSTLNHDLYAYDPQQGIAIVQARMFYRRAAGHYGATRKTYFLVGQNEITRQYFRHPVSSHAVRAAINGGKNPIESIQRWLWEVTPNQLQAAIRQGDILLVPETRPPAIDPIDTPALIIGGSHQITADEIRQNGRIYALNPSVIHTKNQHAPVAAPGWHSIRQAREAAAWNFAQRIGD
jgi:hypothetical protein